jgi:hypothetical protein
MNKIKKMNANYKTNELDDFWNDCIKEPLKVQIYEKPFVEWNNNNLKNNIIKRLKKTETFKKFFKNKRKNTKKGKLSNLNLNINNTDYNSIKSKISSITQTSPYNHKNIRDVLLKEELIPILRKKKKDKSIQKCISIYNKDKANKALRTKLNNSQKIKLEKKELEECTFMPAKNTNKKITKKIEELYNNSNIYDRNIKQRQKYHEKIARLFNEENKMNKIYDKSVCIFHPNIPNKKDYKYLFKENNSWKEHADNDSNKLFLLRYMKARENEYDKNERLLSPINKKLKYNFSFQKKMIRSLSCKDSLLLKKDLHQKLYSYKNLLLDDLEDCLNKKGKEIDNFNIDGIKKENLQWTFAKKTDN